jgi:hypothetical protein
MNCQPACSTTLYKTFRDDAINENATIERERRSAECGWTKIAYGCSVKLRSRATQDAGTKPAETKGAEKEPAEIQGVEKGRMANLASTFWDQGRWKEAKEPFVQVMETRKRVLGRSIQTR